MMTIFWHASLSLALEAQWWRKAYVEEKEINLVLIHWISRDKIFCWFNALHISMTHNFSTYFIVIWALLLPFNFFSFFSFSVLVFIIPIIWREITHTLSCQRHWLQMNWNLFVRPHPTTQFFVIIQVSFFSDWNTQ